MWDFSSLLVCDRGAHIVSSIFHRCSTSTVGWPHMLLLQQARLMQSKIPRLLKYKVMSIGGKIQRRGTAPTNNKNNKDISIFFVTQHQLSIIVKHKQKKSFIKKWQNTYTKTPTSSLQWILKELSKCLKRFYTPVEVLRRAIPWHLLACIFQVRLARLRPEATMRNQFYLK